MAMRALRMPQSRMNQIGCLIPECPTAWAFAWWVTPDAAEQQLAEQGWVRRSNVETSWGTAWGWCCVEHADDEAA